MSDHAKLSASGSARWLQCAAALALEKIIGGGDESSTFADEGTAAHAVLENCLDANKKPSDLLNSEIKAGDRTIAVNQEMVDAVEIAVEYVQRLAARSAFYEEKVDYSDIAPEGFGTADIILEVNEKISPKERVNTLYVIDFKYGKGVRVDANYNSQGMLYALGALRSLDLFFDAPIERVIVVIIQPRMDNISEFEISVEDLEAWGREQKPKADLAYKLLTLASVSDIECKNGFYSSPLLKSEYFNPSKKACQWCQGKRQAKCKAQVLAGFDAAVEGFSDMTEEKQAEALKVPVKSQALKNPAVLENDDLAAIYKSISVFKAFLDGITGEITRRLEAGETVPGLALGEKLGPRKWSLPDTDLIKLLRTAGFQKKHYEKIGVISPTEAEKLLTKIKPKDFALRYDKLDKAAVIREPKPALLEVKIENHNFTPAGSDDLLD